MLKSIIKMKSTPIFNQLPSATSKKYIPTPQAAQLILNYFIYNNFQDFNTWQQIAKTKVEYEYSETNKGSFGCRVTLKWEDRTLPTIIQASDARSKRSAKKRALKKLVESIVNYGYIGLGFREDNFVQKLPRRRKNDSDDSDEELEEEKYVEKMALVQLLQNGKTNDVFQILIKENDKWKISEMIQCWKYGLSKKSLPFLRNTIRAYYKKALISTQAEGMDEQNHLAFDETLLPRQISLGKMVKDPLREDLTDFIRYCQLQKANVKPRELIRKPIIQSQPIPSEFVIGQAQMLSNCFPPSPTMQQLIKHFHPIEGRKIFLSNMRRLSQQNSEELGIELPKFENQYRQVPLKLAEQLYGLLPYFSKDYRFIQKVIQVMGEELTQVQIQFDASIELRYQLKGVEYYCRNKSLLTAQFCYLLYSKINNLGSNVCLEGMVVSQRNGDNVFMFNCKEPEEIVARKINRRANMSQFEEMSEISMNQYVLLVCKIDRSMVYIGQIIELMPSIKIYIPELDDDSTDPMPFTITRIYNSKIFQKTSASISKISKHCMKLFDENTTILWQPPSFPVFSLLAQLLIQWQIMKVTVLVISLDADALHTELTSLGFKSVKITQKTEEKLLVKCNVVVSMPSAVCCELLKNYAFQRVVIEGSHQISEISSLSALVKGCKQLYLIGDPFMPRMQVYSPYCIKNGMGISLLERLYKTGHKTQTFFSRYEDSRQYRNIMEWADKYIYNRQLKLMEKEMLTPIIKGFPWPSIDYRVCYVHHKYEGISEQAYLQQQAFLCSLICGQVVKSGYTKVQHITCSTGTRKNLPFLQKYMTILLRKLNHNDIKLFTKLINRLCRLVTGSIYFRSELSILMLGTDQPSLSFREIIAALRQGRRGVILLGDMNNSLRNPDFCTFIDWCKEHRLICSVDQSQMIDLS